ncbi:MAG: hypothetical protein ACI91F_002519 [Candidatus Binatia bacterium]
MCGVHTAESKALAPTISGTGNRQALAGCRMRSREIRGHPCTPQGRSREKLRRFATSFAKLRTAPIALRRPPGPRAIIVYTQTCVLDVTIVVEVGREQSPKPR